MARVAGKEVQQIGLGLMGLTWRSTIPSQEQAFEVLHASLNNGNALWNGAEFYGGPEFNSLVLVERYLEKYPEDADKIVLSIKGGANPVTHLVDGTPENTRRSIDACIAQLKGRKKIDTFAFGRRDPNVPLEVTFGVIEKEYIQTGKIGGIALSEVGPDTIHEAVKYTKVVAVEAEVSLFSTDILENGVAATCAQYGIPIMAYSPIGRGILTGQIKKLEQVDPLVLSFNFPRFQPENFDINLRLVQKVEHIAKMKGCTPAQLAINWVRSLSNRSGMPTIVPIPGATSSSRVEENMKEIELTAEELEQIDATLAEFTPAGGRWPDAFPTNT